MRKTPKNKIKVKKAKNVKVGKTTGRSQKKLNNKVLRKRKSLDAFSRAQELFASLSLTPRDEHELLQSFFVSALVKGIQKRGSRSLSLAESIGEGGRNEDTQTGLLKADEKIGRILNADADSAGSVPSNAQPKYKNVESILKYNETPDDKGGVKLVIMNFND